jgi:hypothetical protein
VASALSSLNSTEICSIVVGVTLKAWHYLPDRRRH